MGIKKTTTSSFRRVRSGFAVSRHVVRKTNAHIDPLQVNENENRGQEGRIDPARFMSRKQKKAWKRLSPARRRQYIKRAEKEIQRDRTGQGIAIKKKASAFSNLEMTADPETARQLAGWQPGRSGYGKALPGLRRLRFKKERERMRREEEKRRSTASSGTKSMTSSGSSETNTSGTNSSSGETGQATGNSSSAMTTPVGGQITSGSSSQIATSQGASFSGTAVTTAGEGALSSTGAGQPLLQQRKLLTGLSVI